MARKGCDYASGRPSVAALRAAGITFCVRYVVEVAGGLDKLLERAEAQRLSSAGIDLAAVFQTSASFMLRGDPGGRADAVVAQRNAVAAGMPPSRPIYFAADFDVTATQQAAINAYLAGVRAVLGPGRVGVYGGYHTVTRARTYWRERFGTEKLWSWQTKAWSGGQVAPGLDMLQSSLATIDGTSCTLDTAYPADFGQWRIGGTAATEAPTCRVLLTEATRLAPGRQTDSDGICASPEHTAQNPDSDHERCDAADLTHDPGHAVDTYAAARWLAGEVRAGRENRVTYIISNRQICSFTDNARTRGQWGEWVAYGGDSPHTGHMHVSIVPSRRGDTSSWWTGSPIGVPDMDAKEPLYVPPWTKTEKDPDGTPYTVGGVLASTHQLAYAARNNSDAAYKVAAGALAQIGGLSETVKILATEVARLAQGEQADIDAIVAAVRTAAEQGAEAALQDAVRVDVRVGGTDGPEAPAVPPQ